MSDRQTQEPQGQTTGGQPHSPSTPATPAEQIAQVRLPPGVSAIQDGTALSGDPWAFDRLAQHANAATGIDIDRLARDYHMFQGLRRLALEYPPETPVGDAGGDESTGLWAFTGGTALTSAHRVCARFSEDIDIVFIPSVGMSKSRIKKFHKIFRVLLMDGITQHGVLAEPDPVVRRDVTVLNVTVDGVPEFLKYDISHTAPRDWGLQTLRASPLLGRFATAEDLLRFPELAGFGVPTIPTMVIAVNKMLALNRLAETGRFDALADRARDVYDLYCIAVVAAEAALVRVNVEELAAVLASGGVQRQDAERRPPGGFAAGLAFTPRTEAYEALRNGYEKRMPSLVFDQSALPSFEEAVEAARSLDPL